eukprot:558147-Pelagomonas_calceolata.AAC.2
MPGSSIAEISLRSGGSPGSAITLGRACTVQAKEEDAGRWDKWQVKARKVAAKYKKVQPSSLKKS